MTLEALLACPVCAGQLSDVTCTSCGRAYGHDRGVLDFTPVPPPDPAVQERWQLWEQLQANGERAYEDDPPSNLSVGERQDAAAFAAFAGLEGRVLDVGCGPQVMPSYALGMAGELIGIDPLVGHQPRDFTFVKGIAEYLPFADGVFDRVLFATSLDHVLSAPLALAAARRVTRPGGAVVIWAGEPIDPPTRADRARSVAKRLARGDVRSLAAGARAVVNQRRAGAPTATFDVPEGAVDAFHFSHPNAATIEGWLVEAGFTVEAVQTPLPGNSFIRAR